MGGREHAQAGAATQLGADRLFIAGGLSGAVEVCAIYPLDMVKSRFQLSPERSISILAGLREVIAEGGPRLLYRGIVPELLCGIPKASAMFTTYSVTRGLITKVCGGRDGLLTSFCAGAASGVPEACVMTPFQVVKVRLQSKAHLGRYANALHCVRKMVLLEGATSLAKGLRVTIVRNSVYNAVYFSTYRALSSSVEGKGPGWLVTMSCGFAAGLFSTCFGCPFDVLKTRVQAELGTPAAGSIPTRLAHIARTEGPGALWKGFAAKALRMGVGGAVGLGSFELACDVLR